MLAYFSVIGSPDLLKIAPNSGAYRLTGDLDSIWSLTMTKNWRMTFCVNDALGIEDLDREDYH